MSLPKDILVVDGDPASRVLIRLVLQSAFPDGTVLEVADAVALAQAWASGEWWALVFDPQTAPWAGAGRLVSAALERAPAAQVVVCTAPLNPTGMAELFRAGASDFVIKSPETIVDLPMRLKASAPGHEPGRSVAARREDVRPEVPSQPPPMEPSRKEVGAVEPSDPDPVAMIHDLKEPLRTIHMLLERCDRRHRDQLPSEARGLIQWAQRSAKQLSAELDEWHAELSGSVGSEFRSADASEAFADAMRHLRALGEETAAEITTGALPTVGVPISAVRRIFENLLANAMRHRGDDPPQIHVGAQLLDGEAVFSVKDHGTGVPENLRHLVFEPGVRGEDGGAGLGLYGTRRLVERWGGQIWFDSVRGEGTTFYFTLPTADASASNGSKS